MIEIELNELKNQMRASANLANLHNWGEDPNQTNNLQNIMYTR